MTDPIDLLIRTAANLQAVIDNHALYTSERAEYADNVKKLRELIEAVQDRPCCAENAMGGCCPCPKEKKG